MVNKSDIDSYIDILKDIIDRTDDEIARIDARRVANAQMIDTLSMTKFEDLLNSDAIDDRIKRFEAMNESITTRRAVAVSTMRQVQSELNKYLDYRNTSTV